MTSKHFQQLAFYAYFALLIWVPAWHLYLSPPALDISPWLITCIWLFPLLSPIRGILAKNPYTYAWSGFIALIYIVHAIVIIMSDKSELLLAIVELVLATLFLTGNIYFAKYRGRELGLSIRKKNK